MWENNNNCDNTNNNNSNSNNSGFMSPVAHSTNTHSVCVKALHMRRDALKARIRQKHERQRQAERESCMARARDSGTLTNNIESYDNNYGGSGNNNNSGNASSSENNSCNSSRNSYGVEYDNCENTLARYSSGREDVQINQAATCIPHNYTSHLYYSDLREHDFTSFPDTRLDFNKWADVGREFGCDVSEYEVMQYLLELEDEIRQEQLINMYEESNNTTDWDEYYRSLTSE